MAIFNNKLLAFAWNPCDMQVCIEKQHCKVFCTEHFALLLGWEDTEKFLLHIETEYKENPSTELTTYRNTVSQLSTKW